MTLLVLRLSECILSRMLSDQSHAHAFAPRVVMLAVHVSSSRCSVHFSKRRSERLESLGAQSHPISCSSFSHAPWADIPGVADLR
jgi:hypothetical protein